MNCMKCGTQIQEGNVFCERCLSDMKKYPVNPGTPIQLPSRPAPEAVKKAPPRSRVPTAEEKLSRMRQVVKWLAVSLVVSLLLLGFSISLLLEDTTAENGKDTIGQNYNTIGEDRRAD